MKEEEQRVQNTLAERDLQPTDSVVAVRVTRTNNIHRRTGVSFFAAKQKNGDCDVRNQHRGR